MNDSTPPSAELGLTQKDLGIQRASQEVTTPQLRANSIMDARAFLINLDQQKIDKYPSGLRQQLRGQLSSWAGISPDENRDIKQLIQETRARVEQARREEMIVDEESEDTMRLRFRLKNNPGMKFPLEGEYQQEELATSFPQGIELQATMGSELKFKIHAHITGDFYIVERPDRVRQVLRLYQEHRPIKQLVDDIDHASEVLPPMEAHQFKDGSVGVLQNWVDGHYPRTAEEKEMCKDASNSLITVPWEIENPLSPYDLNTTNFLVTNNSEADQAKAYYVDNDLVGIIVRHGLSPEAPVQRQELLTRGKEKLN